MKPNNRLIRITIGQEDPFDTLIFLQKCLSDSVKHRPREHVRDDAGHSSSAITARLLQGMTGALAWPNATSITFHAMPEDKRCFGMGIMSRVVDFGLAIGPILSGVITTMSNWSWVFLIIIPIANFIGFLILSLSFTHDSNILIAILLLFLGIGFAFASPAALKMSLNEFDKFQSGRQIGKTTLLKQWMLALLDSGVDPKRICFFTGELIDDQHALYKLVTHQMLFSWWP